MTILTCPYPNCEFQTDDVAVVGAAAILNAHSLVHVSAPSHATPSIRAPKLERPRLKLNSSCEDWNAFIRRWDTFRIGSRISNDVAPGQLLECTSEQLGNIVLRAYPSFTSSLLPDALKILKAIAVVPVALGVLRSDLLAMRQDPDEPFRTFSARVQGKAETCEFRTSFTGTCGNCSIAYTGSTYYTDEVIRDVLLNGIADNDIRREALSTDQILSKPLTDMITFVESRETARNANPLSSVSVLSAHRRKNNLNERDTEDGRHKSRALSPSAVDKSKTGKCQDCYQTIHIFTKNLRGWNRKPHTRCNSCWRRNRDASQRKQNGETGTISHVMDDNLGQISTININSSSPSSSSRATDSSTVQKRRTLDHHIFNKGEWRRARITTHPEVPLRIAPSGQPNASVDVKAIADTGAQSNLWSLHKFLAAGFTMADLTPVNVSLHAANKSPIRIDGAFSAKIVGQAIDNNNVSCYLMVYVVAMLMHYTFHMTRC